MYELNEKLKKLSPYDPICGEYKIRLDANESPYPLPESIKDEIAKELADLSFNRYPDPLALSAVSAFSGYYNIDQKYVTAGNGSDEIISIIESCFLQKGDKILSFAPDFSMYRFYASLFELESVVLQKNCDLSIDIDKAIETCNRQNIKAVIFSNPCNPTSLGISADDVKRLTKSVNCLVIADEAYMDFWNESVLDSVKDFDNLIVLKTCSKAVGAAAIRLGFAVSNEKITNALRAAKSPYNTDSFSQMAGAVILRQSEWLDLARTEIVKNTQNLYTKITELAEKYPLALERPQKPCTNFVFIKTNSAQKIFNLLADKSIIVRNFDNYLRICTGTENENRILIDNLEDILRNIEKEIKEKKA